MRAMIHCIDGVRRCLRPMAVNCALAVKAAQRHFIAMVADIIWSISSPEFSLLLVEQWSLPFDNHDVRAYAALEAVKIGNQTLESEHWGCPRCCRFGQPLGVECIDSS
jgi:hypothetical protein